MRVRMLAFGTQGDVQPYVALGVELKRRGHEVEIATTADFQEFVEEWGLKCVPTVYFVKSVPHSWLFPQMAAVVHHGGVGTTAEGLRAGVPTVVVAKGGDQPFWGRRVHELGVGPEPLMLKSLTVEKLAKALREAVGDEGMRVRAERMGKLVRSEDGVGKAIKEIEGPMRVFNGTRIG